MSTGQEAVFCGREGNRGFGVALATRHRLRGISTYRLSGLRKWDQHTVDTLLRSAAPAVIGGRVPSSREVDTYAVSHNVGKIGKSTL